jgi:endo-1,4-beta-xylanase
MILLASFALLACAPRTQPLPAAADPSTHTEPPPVFVRPVVVPQRPLDLTNPQQEAVLWPVWGGAFELGEPVSLRVSMAATGAAGIVIVGPGGPRERVTIDVVAADGGWTVRETVGGELAQQLAVSDGPLVIELDGTSVRLGEAALELAGPLGADGDAAGVYVTLEPGAALQIDDLALSHPLPTHPELGPPLRELAEARGVNVGSATDLWPPQHDLGFESLFGEQFGAASPTEFYWPTTRGEDRDWFFVPADLLVNYATLHDQELTGMFLVWDFSLPRWVRDVATDEGPAALGQVLDEHVTTLVERYRGRVDGWVVVNEAIWGPGDGVGRAQYAQTLWYDALGEGYIERAFEVARAADPDATLLYNETGAEMLGEKSDFVYRMVEGFVARGVPIDGVGLQFHVHAASPPDLASVRANLERFAALGLDVVVTELDVSLEGMEGPEAELLALQAETYAGVLEACLAVPACRTWTVFGFSDRYAWDELGEATPLLFTEDYEAKPAFFAVQAAL